MAGGLGIPHRIAPKAAHRGDAGERVRVEMREAVDERVGAQRRRALRDLHLHVGDRRALHVHVRECRQSVHEEVWDGGGIFAPSVHFLLSVAHAIKGDKVL